jgi:hypothetical protein
LPLIEHGPHRKRGIRLAIVCPQDFGFTRATFLAPCTTARIYTASFLSR